MEASINSAKLSQLPRFSCSDIAGIAGYHPWQDNLLLFEKYLYQDLDDLRLLDCKNLGVEMITPEEEIRLLVNKLDEQDRIQLRQIENKIQLDDSLDTMVKAQTFLKEISKLMKEERVMKKISPDELKMVEEEYLGKVRKGYGIRCEDRSLDKYEVLTGFSVVERNMETLRMKIMPLNYVEEPEDRRPPATTTTAAMASTFASDSSSTSINPKTASSVKASDVKTNVFSTLLNASKKMCTEERLSQTQILTQHATVGSSRINTTTISNFVTGDSHTSVMSVESATVVATDTNSGNNGNNSSTIEHEYTSAVASFTSKLNTRNNKNNNNKRGRSTTPGAVTATRGVKPSFLLIGKVDGISYQLDVSHDDPAQWAQTKVVVEMKSRTRRIASPPPIYEQIQLVSYMMILGTTHGDLVQSIAVDPLNNNNNGDDGTSVPDLSFKNNEIHYDNNFSISRVNLHGAPYYHSKHWHEIILPRLRVFRDAIGKMREDDGLRYRYIVAEDEEKQRIVVELCPYFEETVVGSMS